MPKTFNTPPGWGQPPTGPVQKKPMPKGAKITIGVIGGLILIGGCNAIITGGKGIDAKTAAASAKPATTASPKPAAALSSPSAASPTPATKTPAPAPPSSATPAAPAGGGPSCGPTGHDVIVRYITPDLPPSAQVLGDYDLQTCETTFQSLEAMSPKDQGFCTEAAWASDNPGYNADATPAAPLRKVKVAYGPACK